MRRPRGPAHRSDRWIMSRWQWVWVLWRWHRWRGISLPHWIDPAGRTWTYLTGLTFEEKSAVKMPDKSALPDLGGAFGISQSKTLARMSELNSLLCGGTWDGGEPRGKRCLMLFIEGPTVRSLLKVEHPPLKLSSVGRDLDESLAALDALLKGSDIPWEQDTAFQGTRRGKRS